MKFRLFIYLTFFYCPNSQAQKITTISINAPNWENNVSGIIKWQSVKRDSTYFYKKRNNNKDSTLVMTQYFDTSGNLVERDEYDLNGEPFRITNYTYAKDMLLQEESISRESFSVNGFNIAKKLKSYDYDSLGKVIAEKDYSYSGDSLKLLSVTIWEREYDSQGHLIKEFVTLPGVKTFLNHDYNYADGILTEVNNYDFKHTWLYSYIYEHDKPTGIKRVYLFNSIKTLLNEGFYDDQKRLVKEKSYMKGGAYLDHNTQTYFYNTNGLLESQSFQDINGQNYFYKHFYTK